MAELLEVIEKRRAKRALSDKKVSTDLVQRFMKAATYAPSCFNNQPWRFIVVESDESLKKVKDNLPSANYWVNKSQLIVLAVTKNELDCKLDDNRNYAYFDLGLAVGNLVLQASSEGLIAHPIAGFKPVPIKKELGIPDEYTLLNVIVVGHSGDEGHLNEKHLGLENSERVRKPEDEVIAYNSWNNKLG